MADFECSIKCQMLSCEAKERLIGPNNYGLAIALNNMATAYRGYGDAFDSKYYVEAIKNNLRAFQLCLQNDENAPQPTDAANYAFTRATLLQRIGRFEENQPSPNPNL